MEFPPDNDESQLPPPQPNTYYPPQQPDTPYPLPQPPYPYQPPPPVPPKKKRGPLFWLLIIGAAALLCLVFSDLMVVGSHNASTNTATTTQDTPQPTDTSQPTNTPTPKPKRPIATAVPLTLDQQIQQVTLHAVQAVTDGTTATVIVDGGNVTETEKESEQLSNSTTLDHIHLACYTLMRAIWSDSLSGHIKSVDIHIQDNLIDKYGYPSVGDVGQCTLTSDTEQLFVWENLDQDSAWKDYDNTWTLPSLSGT
jgi:hypothetical protein